MSGEWPKEERKRGIYLKPEGLALLTAIIEEERKVNPEGVAAVEKVLGPLNEPDTRWPEGAEL